MTNDILDSLLGPALSFVPPPRLKPILSGYEKPEHLAQRDRWIASKKAVPMMARALVPPLNLHCSVPVAQIAFYLFVSEAHVDRWIKAATGKRRLNHTKWRPELNIYDLLHIQVPA